MRYVIAYDITDDQRRQRAAKLLEGWGRRVQKSVFECELSPNELQEVVSSLKALLVLEEDRCHLYRLCGECVPKRLVLGSEVEAEWEKTVVV
jgi:CRISPR-associated protein Cas2